MSTLNMAFRNLRRRRSRTILTVSGIVIGIAMTFVFLSLVSGLDVQTTQLIRAIGGADITLYNSTRIAPRQILTGQANPLNESLLSTVSSINGVYAVSPQLAFQGYISGTRAIINGINSSTYSVVTGGLNLNTGSFLSEGSKKMVVLGKTIADSLNSTVGNSVILSETQEGGISYQVIGVYETGIAFQDRGCYISLSEAQNMSSSQNLISAIFVKCIDPNDVPNVSAAINSILPQVRAVVPTATLQQVSNVLNTVRLFLLSIGLIALVAGGFGVVNTMLSSVSERTKEIGTLKAIGAKDGQILTIFMSEALLLGVMGGIIGISIGVIVSLLFPMLSRGLLGTSLRGIGGQAIGGVSLMPAILLSNIILCFSLGVIVGVLAGFYPAWRAAKMKPVEALRHV